MNGQTFRCKPEQTKKVFKGAGAFEASVKKEKLILRSGGWSNGANATKNYLLLMDDTKRHNILTILETELGTVEARDISGALQFSKERSSRNILKLGNEKLGNCRRDKKDNKKFNLEANETSGTYYMVAKIRNFSKLDFYAVIFNSEEVELATINSSSPITLDLVWKVAVTTIQKKVIVSFIVVINQIVLKLNKKISFAYLTSLDCSCIKCEKGSAVVLSTDRFNKVRKTQNLLVSAVGHSSRNNLMYYNVHPSNFSKSLMTLECTPSKDFQGIARLEGKNPKGETIFYAINAPDSNVLAVYGSNETLKGYLEDGIIYENASTYLNGQAVMRLKERDSGGVLIDLSTNNELVSFRSSRSSVEIQQSPEISMDFDFLQTAMILSFAVKYFCYQFNLDEIPIPEISYRYNEATNDIFSSF